MGCGNQSWSKLDDEMLKQNRKSRQFHSFTEDEFGDEGYLADAWGGRKIQVVVDQDGDGLIELSSEVVNQIKDALKSEYSGEIVEEAAEKFKVIRDKVGIFVLEDKTGETTPKMFFRGIFKNFSLNKRSFFIEDSFFQGFTLMELLVVLAVMGVMMGLIGLVFWEEEVTSLEPHSVNFLAWFKRLGHKLLFQEGKRD